MKHLKLLLTALATLGVCASAGAQIAANPYLHYDPSIASSISFMTNTPESGNHIPDAEYVSQIDDQSGNGYHGTDADLEGHVEASYPGLEFDPGVFGLNIGSTANGSIIAALAPADQDGLLDMAGNTDGLSIFIVLKVDSSDQPFGQTILSNGPFPNNTGGIGIWRDKSNPAIGAIKAQLGLTQLTGNAGQIAVGQRAIVAFTWNEQTADWRLEVAGGNSGDGFDEGSAQLVPVGGDFSDDEFPLTVGGSPKWANFYVDANLGEVLFYNRYLDPTGAEYMNTISALATKWNTAAAPPDPTLNWVATATDITFDWSGPLNLVFQTGDLAPGSWSGWAPRGEFSPVTVPISTLDDAFFQLGTQLSLPTLTGDLMAHYDASVASSVTTEINTPARGNHVADEAFVSRWADQSGHGFDAIETDLAPAHSEAAYPGANTFSSGLSGIDVGNEEAGSGIGFLTLTPAEQDLLLDFSGAASNGFSIFIVMKIDAENNNQFGAGYQSILNSGPFPNNTGGIGIFRDNGNNITFQLDRATALFTNSGGSVEVGDETVIAFTYDDTTGNWHAENRNAWGVGDGANQGALEATGGDFSADTEVLAIGASTGFSNFYVDATFGEVRYYTKYMDPAGSEYTDVMNELVGKWLTAP